MCFPANKVNPSITISGRVKSPKQVLTQHCLGIHMSDKFAGLFQERYVNCIHSGFCVSGVFFKKKLQPDLVCEFYCVL